MKKTLSIMLCLVLLLSALATAVTATGEKPVGTAYVSIQDFGIRNNWENEEDIIYPKPLGVILPKTAVELYEGDTIASVTARMLENEKIEYSYGGKIESGFYLKAIKNFYTQDKVFVSEFGEFSSGSYSGWMVSCDNWFVNLPASEFTVSDGDFICWQNTCMYGLDIGCDMMGTNPSAAITGIKIDEKYGTLTPAFSAEQKEYTLKLPYDAEFVRVEALQSNYWATCTYYLVDTDTYYKLNRDIPVKDGQQILIQTAYAEYAGDTPTDEDYAIIMIEKQSLEEYIAPFISVAYGEIEAYGDMSLYRDEQKAEIEVIKAAAKAVVSEKESPEEIAAAVEKAKSDIDAVKTDAELKAEEKTSETVWDRIKNFFLRIIEFFRNLFKG